MGFQTSDWNLGLTFTDFKQKSFGFFVNTPSRSVVRTEALVSTRYYWRKKLNEILINFFFFRTVSGNFSDVWRFFMAGLLKLPSRGPEGNFERKKVFEKCLSIPEFQLMIGEVLAKKGRVIKTALDVSRGTFRRNCCGEQINFWPLPDSQQENLGFFPKIVGTVVQHPFYVSTKYSEGTNIRSKKSLESFSDFGDKISKFRSEVFSRPFITELYVSRGRFSRKFFLEKICFFDFPVLQTKKLDFLRRVSFSRLINYPFYETKRVFWEDLLFGNRSSRTSFTDFKQKWSGLLWNNSGRTDKTQTYVSKSFFREIWFPKYRSNSFQVDREQKLFGLLRWFFRLKCITAFNV